MKVFGFVILWIADLLGWALVYFMWLMAGSIHNMASAAEAANRVTLFAGGHLIITLGLLALTVRVFQKGKSAERVTDQSE